MMDDGREGAMSGLNRKPGAAKKAAAKPVSMHIRRATGGGFIAKHEMPMDPKSAAAGAAPPEHILPNMAALQGHVQQAMGDQPDAEMPQAPAGGE